MSANLPPAVTDRLQEFPITGVSASTRELAKSFHTKVFTLFASGQAEMSVYRGIPRFSHNFVHQRGEQADYTLDTPSALVVRSWLLDDARAGGPETRRLMAAWQPDWQRFLQTAAEFRTTDLGALSDSDFLVAAERLYDDYLRAGNAAYLVDALITAGDTDPVESLVLEALAAHHIVGEAAQQLLPHLVAPRVPAYASVAKEARLTLAAMFEASDAPETLNQAPPALQAAVREYTARWWWLENNYFHARVLQPEDVYHQLKSLIVEARQRSETVRQEAERTQATRHQFETERQAVVASLPPSDSLRGLIDTVGRWGSWKDTRKSGVQIGMGLFGLLLTDLARRLGWSVDDVGYLVFPEIRSVLIGRTPMAEVITNRKVQTFYANTDHGYFIVQGEAAEPYFSAQVQEAITDQLIGKSASPGSVQGRVRVILRTESMHDFLEGEILVTNQTTPEFMPIMKRAAAIVTEQGGITSHAAVISRELGIPCVIGTTVATKMLQTGDLVHVDATNGVVRKI